MAGAVLSLLAVGWYLRVEAKWLRSHSDLSRFAAARSAAGTWFKATLLNGLISVAILGPGA